MSGPNAEALPLRGQGEGGEGLGERERYLHGFLTGLAYLHPQPDTAAALVDEVFVLLAQARADGAAEERERIARSLDHSAEWSERGRSFYRAAAVIARSPARTQP